MSRCRICVFAKPPAGGEAKTRLAPAVGSAGASALARAFLEDTWAAVGTLGWARPVLATTDPNFGVDLVPSAETWLQGDGDLGQRLETILSRALESGPAAMAIGADSPGMPLRLIECARSALVRADAVLGPSEDGGFYLLALRRCPAGLLKGLPWSAPDTCASLRIRLESAGFAVAVLEPWFDVDRPEDLGRLQTLLDRGEVFAPATAAALALLGEAAAQSSAWTRPGR